MKALGTISWTILVILVVPWTMLSSPCYSDGLGDSDEAVVTVHVPMTAAPAQLVIHLCKDRSTITCRLSLTEHESLLCAAQRIPTEKTTEIPRGKAIDVVRLAKAAVAAGTEERYWGPSCVLRLTVNGITSTVALKRVPKHMEFLKIVGDLSDRKFLEIQGSKVLEALVREFDTKPHGASGVRTSGPRSPCTTVNNLDDL